MTDAAVAAPPRATGTWARFRRWWANPWGRPRFLFLFTLVYLAWSILPILIAIRFSFNDGRSRSTAQGWSTRWWWGDQELSVFHDPDLRVALYQSLKLAGIAIAVTVPLGVALAIGLTRWRGRAATGSRFLAMVPLVTPEIVMGTALLLAFISIFTFVELGTTAQAIGHITFSVSFVLVIVRGRLVSIGPDVEEAARDLGATTAQALRLVLLPMLWPAIIASAIIVFAISMDDFVVSAFLSSGSQTDTVPVRIYSNARGAPTPALNALASLTLFVTVAIAAVAFLVWKLVSRRGGAGGSAMDELARIEG